MDKGKRKFIEDAARVIDGRVAALKVEYERDRLRNPNGMSLPGDLSAILEAELCAKLIRQLGRGAYRGDPYEIACERHYHHGDPRP